FRKRLGPFKMQMEAVFGRMTEAHDTLTHADRRAEYDAYLASVEKTRGLETKLAQATEGVKTADARGHNVGPPTIPPPASPFPRNAGMGMATGAARIAERGGSSRPPSSSLSGPSGRAPTEPPPSSNVGPTSPRARVQPPPLPPQIPPIPPTPGNAPP